MRRRIVFHGPLSYLNDNPIEIVGDTVAEVLEGAGRQVPALQPNPTTGRTQLAVVGCPNIEDLFRNLGDQKEIHVVPQLSGGKNGLSQVLIGGLLIATSFIPGLGSAAASLVMKIGIGVTLGGIAQMLAPTPDADNETHRSLYLGTPTNTTKIGTRIPIIFGRDRWEDISCPSTSTRWIMTGSSRAHNSELIGEQA